MALAEGSNGGPFWHIQNASEGGEQMLTLVDLDADRVADSILLALGRYYGDSNMRAVIREHENLVEDVDLFAPYWEMDEGLRTFIIDSLCSNLKLGVVSLEPVSLVSAEVLDRLRDTGLEIQMFS